MWIMDFIQANKTCASRAPAAYYRAEGMIKNVNTIEEYRNMDKPHMILQAGKTV
jgi:ubiquitin-like modifier-activating enzyme ATG7